MLYITVVKIRGVKGRTPGTYSLLRDLGKICERLAVDCRIIHPLNLITCLLCSNFYCGESSQLLNQRLNEQQIQKVQAIATKQLQFIIVIIIATQHVTTIEIQIASYREECYISQIFNPLRIGPRDPLDHVVVYYPKIC